MPLTYKFTFAMSVSSVPIKRNKCFIAEKVICGGTGHKSFSLPLSLQGKERILTAAGKFYQHVIYSHNLDSFAW